ncbi:MAG: hypothetical protein FWD25_03450 [Clostridia bacterium]|nr:hypothetical protein [Clostridia bacterium]
MDMKVATEQISRLNCLLSLPSTDVCWSKYMNATEAIEELESLRIGIEKQDKNAIDRLLFLLLPTGDLQEISISSGWGEEFLTIAEILQSVFEIKSMG